MVIKKGERGHGYNERGRGRVQTGLICGFLVQKNFPGTYKSRLRMG